MLAKWVPTVAAVLRAATFRIEHSAMTEEVVKELVDERLIMGYRLPMGEDQFRPKADEVVVFRDCFIAGLVIPYHQFVLSILECYRIQLHERTPSSFAHLSKFIWGMSSNGGDLDIEVFAHHFVLHN